MSLIIPHKHTLVEALNWFISNFLDTPYVNINSMLIETVKSNELLKPEKQCLFAWFFGGIACKKNS